MIGAESAHTTVVVAWRSVAVTAVAASAPHPSPATIASQPFPHVLPSAHVRPAPAATPSPTHTPPPTTFDMSSVDAVVAHTQQENVVLLSRHAGTFAAERRARLRAWKYIALREGLTTALSVPFLPDRPRNRFRAASSAPEGPSKQLLAERLHNERLDFSRSQGNPQLGISQANSSDKAYAKLLRKVSEASKCLVNRHAKLEEMEMKIRAANKDAADAAAATTAAAKTPPADSVEDADIREK